MPIPVERTSGLVSEGTHLFKITRVEEKANQSNGTPLLVVEMTCQDAGADQGLKYTEFFQYLPDAAARWKFNQFLDALEAPKKGPGLEVVWFMNKLIRITIQHQEFPAGSGTIKGNSQQYHVHTSTANPEVKHASNTGPKNALNEMGGSSKAKAPF